MSGAGACLDVEGSSLIQRGRLRQGTAPGRAPRVQSVWCTVYGVRFRVGLRVVGSGVRM